MVLVALRLFSVKGHQRELLHTVPFRGIVVSFCIVSELVPIRGKKKKHFKQHPQKRIFLPLKGSFQNF